MTKPDFQPPPPGPSAMGGTQRMIDPTESEHDRVRRRWMNLGFVGIGLLVALQVWLADLHGWHWVQFVALVIAGAPLAMAVRVFELRFKMAREERLRALRQLPRRVQGRWVGYSLILTLGLLLQTSLAAAALLGMWVTDFVGYYHDRPLRLRHLYAITQTLDDLRDYPLPWAWALPALLTGVWALAL